MKRELLLIMSKSFMLDTRFFIVIIIFLCAPAYRKMKHSEEFKEYVNKTRKLRNIDLAPLSEDEKKAFFINVYNCLILHAIAWKRNKSIFGEKLGRLFFYGCSSYYIGNSVYSLNDIEHGILRGNKISPVPNSVAQFSSNDERLPFIMKQLDPRIHFALNCGAKGCPPIAIYKAASIDKQLTRAAKGFLRNIIINKEQAADNTVHYTVVLSQILNWYGHDFGNNDLEILTYILQYVEDENSNLLQEIIDLYKKNEENDDFAMKMNLKIEFEPYNWSINGV